MKFQLICLIQSYRTERPNTIRPQKTAMHTMIGH